MLDFIQPQVSLERMILARGSGRERKFEPEKTPLSPVERPHDSCVHSPSFDPFSAQPWFDYLEPTDAGWMLEGGG